MSGRGVTATSERGVEPPIAPMARFLGFGTLTVVAKVTLLVIAILNLTGTISDFGTGIAFLAGGACTLTFIAVLYKDGPVLGEEQASKIRMIMSYYLFGAIFLLAGGALGVSGVISNQTLGWFYFAPMLAMPVIVACRFSEFIPPHLNQILANKIH